jgi:hypothetical protein
VTGRLVSPGTPVSSTNKTDRHDLTEILLKVAINNIKQTKDETLRYGYCKSDFCLTPTQQFSAISWQEQVNFQ